MAKTRLHSQIEEDIGLKVERIKDAEHLASCLDSGLVHLYQEAFSGPPYFENFNIDTVKGYFQDYLSQGGHIFVAMDNKRSIPVAFVASVPLRADFEVASKVSAFVDPDKTHYFAEDGVAQSYRKNGISAKMKKLLLESVSISGAQKMILRTSQYNYKQISAVNKSGGVVISGLFQEVSSTRQNGTVARDTRAFYQYDLEASNMNSPNIRKLQRVVVARPGGNDTAFVFDEIPREEQGDLSKEIQKIYPGIEQVMFIEKGKVLPIHGQMAGGEFCGNATRSLGFVIGQGQDGHLSLEVSNGSAIATADVEISNGNARTSVPVRHELDAVQRNPATGEYVVDMDGIAFLVTTPDQKIGREISACTTIEDQKTRVRTILEDTGLAQKPASGLLIVKETGENTRMLDPFVLVRDTGTLYYETGCGSGSTALGLIVALTKGVSVKNLEVVQPSGMSLFVTVERDDKQFHKAYVDGPVEVISDGSMYIAISKISPAMPSGSLKQGLG